MCAAGILIRAFANQVLQAAHAGVREEDQLAGFSVHIFSPEPEKISCFTVVHRQSSAIGFSCGLIRYLNGDLAGADFIWLHGTTPFRNFPGSLYADVFGF